MSGVDSTYQRSRDVGQDINILKRRSTDTSNVTGTPSVAIDSLD